MSEASKNRCRHLHMKVGSDGFCDNCRPSVENLRREYDRAVSFEDECARKRYAARERRDAAALEYTQAKYNVRPGTIITSHDTKESFKVVQVRVPSITLCILVAVAKRKDGTWSKVEKHVYNPHLFTWEGKPSEDA